MCKFLYRIVKNLLLTSPRWWFYVQIKGLPLVEEALWYLLSVSLAV